MLAAETLAQLNEYRAFRHIVIHRYGFELRPDGIQVLVQKLPNCYDSLKGDVQDFCQVLLKIDQAL